MTDNIMNVVLGAAFIDSIVLEHLIGVTPLLGLSKRHDVAKRFALVMLFAIPVASLVLWLIDVWVLQTANILYLRLPVWVLLLAALWQFLTNWTLSTSSLEIRKYAVFFPLLTLNSMVLGAVLLVFQNTQSFTETLVLSCGIAMGFSGLIVVFASLNERLDACAAPVAFRGTPIKLISLGIISLALQGLGSGNL